MERAVRGSKKPALGYATHVQIYASAIFSSKARQARNVIWPSRIGMRATLSSPCNKACDATPNVQGNTLFDRRGKIAGFSSLESSSFASSPRSALPIGIAAFAMIWNFCEELCSR
ncbi:hypothetical protein HAX54_021225 [Datura stramonium]|uniref:Uncharacterized protein n=1 Tax=Datura stramonium TaxID=4076 RepID=A0ABS8USL3_DATST|nr:hypothetical protein [Datura stramonium]